MPIDQVMSTTNGIVVVLSKTETEILTRALIEAAEKAASQPAAPEPSKVKQTAPEAPTLVEDSKAPPII